MCVQSLEFWYETPPFSGFSDFVSAISKQFDVTFTEPDNVCVKINESTSVGCDYSLTDDDPPLYRFGVGTESYSQIDLLPLLIWAGDLTDADFDSHMATPMLTAFKIQSSEFSGHIWTIAENGDAYVAQHRCKQLNLNTGDRVQFTSHENKGHIGLLRLKDAVIPATRTKG